MYLLRQSYNHTLAAVDVWTGVAFAATFTDGGDEDNNESACINIRSMSVIGFAKWTGSWSCGSKSEPIAGFLSTPEPPPPLFDEIEIAFGIRGATICDGWSGIAEKTRINSMKKKRKNPIIFTWLLSAAIKRLKIEIQRRPWIRDPGSIRRRNYKHILFWRIIAGIWSSGLELVWIRSPATILMRNLDMIFILKIGARPIFIQHWMIWTRRRFHARYRQNIESHVPHQTFQ